MLIGLEEERGEKKVNTKRCTGLMLGLCHARNEDQRVVCVTLPDDHTADRCHRVQLRNKERVIGRTEAQLFFRCGRIHTLVVGVAAKSVDAVCWHHNSSVSEEAD